MGTRGTNRTEPQGGLVMLAVSGWLIASMLGCFLVLQYLAGPQKQPPAKTPPAADADGPLPETPPEPGPTPPRAEPARREQAPPARRVEPAANRHAVEIEAHLDRAETLLQAGDYESAIESYDRVLELDPENDSVRALRRHLLILEGQRAIRSHQRRVLQFQETKTEYAEAGGSPSTLDVGGVQVRRATGPSSPGELVLELQPRTVQPGDPFTFRVRLHNRSNTPLPVRSIELIRTAGNTRSGAGQARSPRQSEIAPRSVGVVFEEQSTWTEEMSTGSYHAVVTLPNGELRKTLSWRP